MSEFLYTPLNLNMRASKSSYIYTRFKKTDILVRGLDRNLAFLTTDKPNNLIVSLSNGNLASFKKTLFLILMRLFAYIYFKKTNSLVFGLE